MVVWAQLTFVREDSPTPHGERGGSLASSQTSDSTVSDILRPLQLPQACPESRRGAGAAPPDRRSVNKLADVSDVASPGEGDGAAGAGEKQGEGGAARPRRFQFVRSRFRNVCSEADW